MNCPFGADKTDVENHEPLMTGIHNLINPDDWFPQVVMDWWGFKRYGYTQDHDITGTYATDGSLHKRNLSVWDPTNATRKAAVNDMISKLKAVDPHTAFNSTFFRQHYFSKASVVKNTVVKIGSWLWNRLGGSKIVKLEEPDIFQISIDEKGEGNQFVSKNAELKYNQGAYYQEFMKFFLNSAGFSDDPAKARKHYVDNYQDAMVDLMYWVCGQPLDVREKFSKVASSQVKKSFKQMQDEGVAELNKKNPILGKVGSILNTSVGTWISYIAAALWSVNDSSASVPSALINRTLKNTFNELKVPYTQAQLDRASNVIAKLAYNYYSKEQDIAKFCFFHSLTMYKAGSSIAQSHWPEQSLAWFKQCKPGNASKKSKDSVITKVQTQSSALTAEPSAGLAAQSLGTQDELTNHDVYAYFDDDPDMLYDQGETDNGEILGVMDISDKYNAESIVITSWNMYDFNDFIAGKPALKTVDLGYEMQESDPEFIVLTPNSETLGSKHVNLWLNKAMTGFDQDTLIGSFDLYDGGYHYIAQTALPEGVSADGFDVLYYGDNENLINREGVVLDGWTSAADEEGNLVGFLPNDFVDYNELPEGDTVDLYAVWLDPVAYGVTYHANRSQDDNYMVEGAQFSDDENTLVIQGLAGDDEGMQNPGKVFVGWNTAPDGSGQMIEAGKGATLEQLGLGTRTQYLQDLNQLATLEVQETPTHYVEPEGDTSSAADEFEAELEAKYTVHLYAQWADPATWKRLEGDVVGDAYDTMTEVVAEGWTSSDTVVIASFDSYWDALSASALAGSEDAPVLLTDKGSLSPKTRKIIESLGAKKAYICGEKEAVSKDVEDEITNMGLTVERFGGDMAFNTAEKISAKAKPNFGADCDTCVIATIYGFYDSLSVAPAAYSLGMPVYLTGWGKTLEKSTVDAIKAAGYKKAVIVGGTEAVLGDVEGQLGEAGIARGDVTRLAGQNAWETSELIAEWGLGHGLNAKTVGVADGNGYWDALTGAPLIGLRSGSLVLVPHDGPIFDYSMNFSYDQYCIDHFVKGNATAIRQGYVFGGEAAVSKQAYDACVAATESVVSSNETEIGA